jgi:hypothetical protein
MAVRPNIHTVLEGSNIVFLGLNFFPSEDMRIVDVYKCYTILCSL